MRSIAMMSMTFGGLVIMVCLTFSDICAQASIEGTVRSNRNVTLGEARVVLIDQDNGTRRDEAVDWTTGKFTISNVQNGKYTLVACAGKDYNPTRLSLEVKDNKDREEHLTLGYATARTTVKGKFNSRNVDVSALAYDCAVATTKTDAHGAFRFEALPVPPKTYTVSTQVSEGANTRLIESNPVAVKSGGETEIALNLNSATDASNALVAELLPHRCDAQRGEQTDLSGTYSGKLNYSGIAMPADATITITGNDFTLTSGSQLQSGTITAVSTCGYVAGAIMFKDLTLPPSSNPPPKFGLLSLRIRKVGDSLSFRTIPGEKISVWFESTLGAMHPRRSRAKK